MSTEFRPNYIKLVSEEVTDKWDNLYEALIEYRRTIDQSDSKEDPTPEVFGHFQYVLCTNDCAVLRFFPYSEDWNTSPKDTVYETQNEALKAAIEFLERHGYKAKDFDLDLYIDSIEV